MCQSGIFWDNISFTPSTMGQTWCQQHQWYPNPVKGQWKEQVTQWHMANFLRPTQDTLLVLVSWVCVSHKWNSSHFALCLSCTKSFLVSSTKPGSALEEVFCWYPESMPSPWSGVEGLRREPLQWVVHRLRVLAPHGVTTLGLIWGNVSAGSGLISCFCCSQASGLRGHF